MSKELELIAGHGCSVDNEGIRRCFCGEWQSDPVDMQNSLLAHSAHVVSVLSAHGYSIVEGDKSTTYWLGCGTAAWPDPLRLYNEEQALAWLEEYRSAKRYLSDRPMRLIRVTEVRSEVAAAAEEDTNG